MQEEQIGCGTMSDSAHHRRKSAINNTRTIVSPRALQLKARVAGITGVVNRLSVVATLFNCVRRTARAMQVFPCPRLRHDTNTLSVALVSRRDSYVHSELHCVFASTNCLQKRKARLAPGPSTTIRASDSYASSCYLGTG